MLSRVSDETLYLWLRIFGEEVWDIFGLGHIIDVFLLGRNALCLGISAHLFRDVNRLFALFGLLRFQLDLCQGLYDSALERYLRVLIIFFFPQCVLRVTGGARRRFRYTRFVH